MSDTGTAANGISVARQLCRNRIHHQEHEQPSRSSSVFDHLLDRHLDEARGVVGHGVGEALREALGDLGHRALHVARDRQRVGAGLQEDAHQRRRPAVDAADEVVVLGGELDARHVLQAQRRAVGVGAQR